ncbi:hypothetical protein QUF61_05005 [Candidatus Venteria ishoeyi]|uniref:hypothetical protein n=1 Tax=Candidatus Venteria ishoeyi TaxID=1899563 RepID=UPI0025A654BD|nr:hypothetical protein [Candidatus Venteria ishoeyi]MDM8545828.1 hypothetical protein [Candidatus Venteria ishoeyi]
MIQLPSEFDAYREVEIIVLPVESHVGDNKSLSTHEFIQRFAGAIPDFPDLESSGELQECGKADKAYRH